jgi:hypothetical protein
VRKRSTDRDKQDPPEGWTAHGGGPPPGGAGQTSWLEVIRHINSNPIVVYDRIVRQRRKSQAANVKGWFKRLFLRSGLWLPLIPIVGALCAICYPMIFRDWLPPTDRYQSFADDSSQVQLALRWLLLGYTALLAPAIYRCAVSAVQFLAEHKRAMLTGSGIDELLAISRLSDREILLGFVYTRLAPLWRLYGWFTLAASAAVYLEGIVHPAMNELYATNNTDLFFVFIDWFINGGLEALLATIVLGAWMFVGLVLASLIWVLYYICLSRGLQGATAINLTVFSMIAGQLALWIWLLSTEGGRPGFEQSEFISVITSLAVFTGLAPLMLALARRIPTVRFGLARFLPLAMGMAPLLYPLADMLVTQGGETLERFLFESYYPFIYTGFSIGYSYELPAIPDMLDHGYVDWFGPSALLLLAQLILVPIVLSFATEAVHSRRQRPA